MLSLFLLLFSCGETPKDGREKNRLALKKAKVKSMKVTQYTYKFGKVDEASGITLLEALYDNGYVTKETHPNKIITFTYSDLNKTKRLVNTQELDTAFILGYQTDYEYPPDEGMIATRFNIDKVMMSKVQTKKDEFDRDTTILVYDRNGALSSKTMVKYDEEGMTELVRYGANDQITEKIDCVAINEQNRLFIKYNEGGAAIETYTEYYDKDGNLVEYINNSLDATQYKHFKRKYSNNLIDEEVTYLRNGEPKSLIKYIYTK
ncbi:hypothetical protein D0T56_07550 [Dysgonomonas sp. 520]|nr:hypothetical protein [Dysgonomonas sp. 520]